MITYLQITANPSDINILPEYAKDPRVVTNLIDGVNRTRDDVHMWLAPFTPGGNHYVYIKFEKAVKIALIRIWVGSKLEVDVNLSLLQYDFLLVINHLKNESMC